jgi:hypothetical protein
MKEYIVAENYLCFMALLEMIVSETMPHAHFTQNELAELFGITVPIGAHTPIKNVQYSNNIAEFGTNICVKEINDFFNTNMIPLQLSFISSCYFDEMTFADTIKKNDGAYIIFAFGYGLLYNESQNNDVGHVALLEAIDIKMDTIQIYDPGPRNHGSKNVKVDDLVYAMKTRGGIYLFKKVFS